MQIAECFLLHAEASAAFPSLNLRIFAPVNVLRVRDIEV